MTIKLGFCTGVGAGMVGGSNAEFLWVRGQNQKFTSGKDWKGKTFAGFCIHRMMTVYLSASVNN